MKYAISAVVVFFTLAFVCSAANATTPSEQLQTLTVQLQQSPADDALRERIIRLAAGIKPPPAIPESANRAFVRGNVFQKGATDPAGYQLAISSYREALAVAPWWGDAWFNLAAALESANQVAESVSALKMYIASVPTGSAEARDAQDRIYTVEAKAELAANSEATKETRAREQAEAFRRSLDGGVWVCQDDSMWKETLEVRGGQLFSVSVSKKNHNNDSSYLLSTLKGNGFPLKGRALCNPGIGAIDSNICDSMAKVSDEGNIIYFPVIVAHPRPGGGYEQEVSETNACRRAR